MRRLIMAVILSVLGASLLFAPTPASALSGADTGVNYKMLDSCDVHTNADMDTWYTSSPYWIYGYYLGGANTHCGTFTASSLAHNQTTYGAHGWHDVPIYVGRQNPCSSYTVVVDKTNYANAEAQGQYAGYDAYNKMTALGYPTGSIAYYDMEGAGGSSEACIVAMTYFIKGWDEKLHSYGDLAGYYGGACDSYVDRMFISIPPDDVWFRDTNGNSSVFDTAGCISASHWPSNQRIKQYVGDHSGPYPNPGGPVFRIDSDCSDGATNGQRFAVLTSSC